MIKARLEELSHRERLLLAGGALLAFATLLYLFAWRPMVAEQARLKEQVERKQALLVWMSAAREEVKRLQPSGSATVPSDMALERLLADQLSRLQLKAERLAPNGAGEVMLSLDNADFSRLLQLLEQSSRDGIRLLKADLRSAASPGRVAGQLTFSK